MERGYLQLFCGRIDLKEIGERNASSSYKQRPFTPDHLLECCNGLLVVIEFVYEKGLLNLVVNNDRKPSSIELTDQIFLSMMF
jgi:hypothetical protein